MKRLHEGVRFDADLLTDLRLLVAKGEGETLEFKRRATHPEKIVREMVAFANTKGGVLLVGVGDDKTLPGLKYPDEESQAVTEAIHALVRPELPYTESIVMIDENRSVLRYDVPAGSRKPYSQKLATGGRESYVRVRDQSIKASAELKEILRRRGRGRGTHIRYGEEERLLMNRLDQQPEITLTEFRIFSKLNRYMAARKLVRLVLAGVLTISPDEKGDRYRRVAGWEQKK